MNYVWRLTDVVFLFIEPIMITMVVDMPKIAYSFPEKKHEN